MKVQKGRQAGRQAGRQKFVITTVETEAKCKSINGYTISISITIWFGTNLTS